MALFRSNCCIAFLLHLCHGDHVSNHDFSTMRTAMVKSQLRTNNVSDPRVVAAMEAVAREDFVPADRKALAYVDVSIPLGKGRALNAPMATARLLTEAALRPVDKVLLIGAATGYAAALLAQLVDHVTAVEEDSALATQATAALGGNPRVTIVNDALTNGCQKGAPYDVIVVDGAVAALGEALTNQLAEGGRLVTGVIERGVTRLARGRRAGGSVSVVAFADVETVILPGFDTPAGFTF
jgi:protein-L-isoaspartate(D-aspartate) O-methyltransferase